jgi:hypothetical protein
MDRWPYSHIFSEIIWIWFCLVPILLWFGGSANVNLTLFFALLLSVFSIIISAGLLRWRKLPLNATVGEYNERVRFLRNEVYRVPLDD